MNEWIRVEDELPKIGERVLISIPVVTDSNIESAKYEGDGRFLGAWYGKRGDGCSYKVTHWMPRPELYKE